MTSADIKDGDKPEEKQPLDKIKLTDLQGTVYLTLLPFVVGGAHTPDVDCYIKYLSATAINNNAVRSPQPYEAFHSRLTFRLSSALMKGAVRNILKLRGDLKAVMDGSLPPPEMTISHDNIFEIPKNWPHIPFSGTRIMEKVDFERVQRTIQRTSSSSSPSSSSSS